MSTPAALHVRPARIADARIWAALAMVALQIVLLPPPGVSIGTTHARNVLAGGSLLLAAAGLLPGRVPFPFADRIRRPLRLPMIPVWPVAARPSMIATGF
ncbi:MAG: hypothetical protein J0H05_01880 [Stenotrophomonas acidaminiphila]|uniref:hypothetical protein n=1 Tax=Stenotrophomonas acidaminiphila TaxID=128780 RepID=UPI001AC13A22|nr:hypothetical protein [Stenotrophomonas acidaminiphila]MBN8800406.1 hypothetical protein [Stenotrophomonas acidaminiphila]MDF9442516.1 hypothetical protein [Stenotrophomonas acidaminiphila]